MSKTMTYTAGIEHSMECLMPKKSNGEMNGFGARLATFRKAAGYTQQELANEMSVSRRMIAYYEGETQHPPTTLLPKLAEALNISTDELLNVKRVKKTKPKPMSNRLQRKLQQIDKLGAKEKRQAMQLLDMFIEHEQLKKQA